MKKQTYATEGALCDAFQAEAESRGWDVYAETHDWDLLMVRRKKPLRIFVNSMSDLFHGQLSDEDIAAVFGVMAAAPRHTFQVLTKRPERMKAWFEWLKTVGATATMAERCGGFAYVRSKKRLPTIEAFADVGWPLPNVWLGVSVEDQATADVRIPHLIACPAAVRFISLEPLLAPVNMRGHLLSSARPGDCRCGHGHGFTRCPNTGGVATTCHHVGCACDGFSRVSGEGIGGVIVGGESGPGARPCDPAWAREVRDQCRAAGVPFFMKQLGALPVESGCEPGHVWVGANPMSLQRIRHPKGGDPAEWPADLRVRETP